MMTPSWLQIDDPPGQEQSDSKYSLRLPSPALHPLMSVRRVIACSSQTRPSVNINGASKPQLRKQLAADGRPKNNDKGRDDVRKESAKPSQHLHHDSRLLTIAKTDQDHTPC